MEQPNGTLEQFLTENKEPSRIVNLAPLCRKRYLCDQKVTSVNSKTPDCSHIFYFEAFKAQKIYLDRERDIWIYPEFLARAFSHKDVYLIAKELCCAIFNAYDLNRRNYQLLKSTSDSLLKAKEVIQALSYAKRDCVARLTKWIFERNHCPWIISSAYVKTLPEFSHEKNAKYLEAIYLAFLTFEKISEYRDEGINPRDHAKFIEWLNQLLPIPDSTNAHVFDEETFEKLIAKMDKNGVENSEINYNDSAPNPLDVTNSPDTIYTDGTPQTVRFQRAMENNFFYEEVFRKLVAEMDKAFEGQSPYSTVDLVRVLTKLNVHDCEDIFSDAAQFSPQRWNQAKELVKQMQLVKAADVLFRKYFRLDFEFKTFNDLEKDFCPIKFLAITRAIAKLLHNESEDNHNLFLDWKIVDEIIVFLNKKYKGKTYRSSGAIYETLQGNSLTMDEIPMDENESNEGLVLWKILLTKGQWSVHLLMDGTGKVTLDPAGPPNPVSPQATSSSVMLNAPPYTDTINYFFDDKQNLIIPKFKMTVNSKLWKKLYGIKREKETKRGKISVNVLRGKELFDNLFDEEEKRTGQLSDRNGVKQYCLNTVQAILAIIAILKELESQEVDVENLANRSGLFAYELTPVETNEINSKVFTEWGNYTRRSLKTKQVNDNGAIKKKRGPNPNWDQ